MGLSFEESLKKSEESNMMMKTRAMPMMAMALNTEEYWQNHSAYKQYSFFVDDDISTITKEKYVLINEKQINISQEENSQYIPFEMPRYYDGYDLVQTTISIHYDTSAGYHGVSEPVNVKYNDDKIRFAWLVDAGATQTAGKLKVEIHAVGVITDNQGNSSGYVWKTRCNEDMRVLQSLCGVNCDGAINIDDSWVQELVKSVTENFAEQIAGVQVAEQVTAAEQAASRAEQYATQAEQAAQSAADAASNAISSALEGYATEEFVAEKMKEVDVSEQLFAYAKTEYVDEQVGLINTNLVTNYRTASDTDQKVAATLEDYATKEDVANAISSADLDSYYKKTETYSQTEIDEKLENISVDLTGYATETYVDNKVAAIKSNVDANATNITNLSQTVSTLQETVGSIDVSPNTTYDIDNDPNNPDVGENGLVLYEITKEGTVDEERSVKKRLQLQAGGGGGSVTGSSLKVAYVTTSPLVVTIDDSAIIKYNFSGTDPSGDRVTEGVAVWKIGSTVITTNTAVEGENEFDVTEYLSIGSQKVNLTVTDDNNGFATKTWTVQKIDVRIESTFNDKISYPLGTVSFDYTPYGAVSKDVHFKLDGEEIGQVTTASSGIPMSYEVPAQEHGSHLLEVYIDTEINGNKIESNHILKDILWQDGTSEAPIIGSVYQNFSTRQYDTTNIEYTVIDPSTETPTVTIAIDGTVVSTPTLSSPTAIYQFKSAIDGIHTITITCRDTVKTLTANVEKVNINIEPVTAGLVFDFNPIGKSNADADRVWSNGTVSMSVSDNFDWVNGGYQIDEKGDQYFCIKAGTSAEINYKLFADDAKKNGKEFKIIFKTVNVANENATFLKCVDNTTDSNHIGIQMDVHEARIYAQSENLPLPYAENSIMEFEFNISKNTETPAMVMGYENGVSTRPLVYGDSHSFTQTDPQTISLGSPDCDLHIYRFKVYNTSLTARGILNNFIADARNAEEMIARYNRNQIYDENSQLTPEILAEKCPWLRIIKIETPRFTKDKDDKVAGATIECIFKGGDPLYDNWIATDCVTSGQGTSSNNYGPAGRNLDLIMKTYKDYGNNPEITLGDGKTKVSKISLTRNSVEINYLNVKVNIASSENANNACIAKRYNDYNPYNRPFIREDETLIPKIKDTMEFQNCVIFIKESDPDLSTHVEFADNDWHFYSFGNVGDSKKTDKTRLTDPTDKYECILEVMDNTLPNSTMPTGKVDSTGAPVYPISADEWIVGNTAYDALYADTFDEAKSTDKANGLADTYGWRYIYEDGSDEENTEARQYVENKWKEFYSFVVTSSDEDFKAHLGDYCVLDSVMFYYLFTLRYTMTDNHAKNSFWHYGKTNDVDSEGNPIRKWDLSFGYDFDKTMSK